MVALAPRVTGSRGSTVPPPATGPRGHGAPSGASATRRRSWRGRAWRPRFPGRSRPSREPFGFPRTGRVPPPDGPVVRTAILLTLHVEAGDRPEDFQPHSSVAANLDLG